MSVIIVVALLLLVFSTARWTRLASVDDIATPMRLWIDNRFGQTSFLSRLIWCFWCSGVWVSILNSVIPVAVAAWYYHLPWWAAILIYIYTVPAVAYAASWLIDHEG